MTLAQARRLTTSRPPGVALTPQRLTADGKADQGDQCQDKRQTAARQAGEWHAVSHARGSTAVARGSRGVMDARHGALAVARQHDVAARAQGAGGRAQATVHHDQAETEQQRNERTPH